MELSVKPTKKIEGKEDYTICWFDSERRDATIIGIIVERNGMSDNDWTIEKRKVETILQKGLDIQ